ncbi:MAG: YaiI/YqxD family protein, partial [Gammaproteobacteria bacterium]
MKIWVDADACPGVIKEILFRAAQRVPVFLTLVANQALRTPASPYINSLQVAAGFDVADNVIAQHVNPGDLVVTADIPLAADVIARGAHALNPRGELYTADNIQALLTLR